MNDMLKVIPIRGGIRDDGGSDQPPINDIPAQLRQMADMVESGDYRGCTSMFVVMPQSEDYPLIFGWGDVKGRCDPLVQFELAKAWFISQAFSSEGWRV